jgi:hypothetical protein
MLDLEGQSLEQITGIFIFIIEFYYRNRMQSIYRIQHFDYLLQIWFLKIWSILEYYL